METASRYGECLQNEKNPIFQKEDGSWWFYDKTWITTCGPFQSEEEATDMFYHHITSRDDETDHSRAHQEKNEPVFQKEDGSWWFYDETWIDTYGPYKTEDEAKEKLRYYIKIQLGG